MATSGCRRKPRRRHPPHKERHPMRNLIIAGSILALSGCAQLPAWLQANGASATTAANVNTVLSTAVADGSLFCSIAGVVAAVPGVNVKGASAQSVATACATAQLVGAAVTAGGAALTGRRRGNPGASAAAGRRERCPGGDRGSGCGKRGGGLGQVVRLPDWRV